MNLHKAWEGRERLNEKMSRLLLQGLQTERINYLRMIENYPPDRMEKYGQPMLDILEAKISTIEQMIAQKFTA
jgi:hypothetical protein